MGAIVRRLFTNGNSFLFFTVPYIGFEVRADTSSPRAPPATRRAALSPVRAFFYCNELLIKRMLFVFLLPLLMRAFVKKNYIIQPDLTDDANNTPPIKRADTKACRRENIYCCLNVTEIVYATMPVRRTTQPIDGFYGLPTAGKQTRARNNSNGQRVNR